MPNSAFQRKFGPWAVVTGASDGIGKAFAEHLAAHGLNMVLVARRQDVLSRLADQLRREHAIDVRVVASDLSLPQGNVSLFAETKELDVGLVVAAAGFGTSGEFLSQAPDHEIQMLQVNCRAVLEQTWHFGNRLRTRGGGGMVLFGSLLGFQGAPLSANYAATKAFVQTLAEGLRVEWLPLGIDVIACAPGPVHTGFAQRADMHMAQATTPDVVARDTLAALGRKGTVRPGWLSKFLGWSLSTAPRSLRVHIMGQIMRGMTAHQATPRLVQDIHKQRRDTQRGSQ